MRGFNEGTDNFLERGGTQNFQKLGEPNNKGESSTVNIKFFPSRVHSSYNSSFVMIFPGEHAPGVFRQIL